MKKKQNKELLTVTAISLLSGIGLQYWFFGNFIINSNILTNIVTILAIFFGFYITSFAIFTTSEYLSGLYHVDDEENPSQTLMHTLIFKYKSGLLITLLSIFYFVVIIFFSEQTINSSLLLNNLYTYPIISIFILNIIYAYIMLTILIRVIKQESKIKKDDKK